MICPKCGKTYGNKISYCISCGIPLEAENGTHAEIPTEQEATPITLSPNLFAPDEPLTEPAATVRSISMTSPIERTRQKKAGGGFMRITASALLSVSLFASMILFFGSCIGRAITDESNAAEAVRNMDILNIPAKELHISAFENDTFSDNSTVGEAIAAMTVGSGVDESNIRRIYERSTVKEFIGNTAAEYAEYIRSGKKPEEVTPEKVKSLLGENISVISTNTGVELSDSDIELAYSRIELSKDALASLSAASLEQGKSGTVLKAVRAYLSAPIVLAELIFSAAAVSAVIVINKNKRRAMGFCGTPVFLAGFTAALFTFMYSIQLVIFAVMDVIKKDTAAGISAAVSQNAYQISAAMMFAGLCMLIAARQTKANEQRTKNS